MAAVKIVPRVPKGMRDFCLPTCSNATTFLMLCGLFSTCMVFEPLQTPIIELKETLYGKYGEDAEKLIYSAPHPGGNRGSCPAL